MKIRFNSIFLSACLLGTSLSALAIPAKPGLRNFTQPDGTTLQIRLQGDHRSRMALTADGLLLCPNDRGGYDYAVPDAQGIPVPSGRMAREAKVRTDAERRFLISIDQKALQRRSTRREGQEGFEKGPGLCATTFPSTGDQRALVILVETSDVRFGIDDPQSYFSRMLNEEGFADHESCGSARDWFMQNSNCAFRPGFDVYGPVTLGQKMSYYGKNDRFGDEPNAHKMVIEGCTLLDSQIDFHDYDRDGDGVVDNVFVFYAGAGEADSGKPSTVWPHSAEIGFYTSVPFLFDGVKVNHYACTNEQPVDYDHPDGIGTFIHEFSHVMGLPDLYSYNGAFTPGEWSILDVGPYNNEGRTPPNYSAYERYALGWLRPTPIANGETSLEPLADSNQALILKTDNENEYFLFENRRQEGFDQYIPGHGMLVWHIHFDQRIFDANMVNDTPSHQYVDLLEADDSQNEQSRAGDAFPGTADITFLSHETSPGLRNWTGQTRAVELYDIEENGDLVTFRVEMEESGMETASVSKAKWSLEGRLLKTTATAEVFDLWGSKIANLVSGTSTSLEPGIYLLAFGDGTRSKIMVK